MISDHAYYLSKILRGKMIDLSADGKKSTEVNRSNVEE